MKFIIILLKIILMLALVLLVASPLIFEYLSFRKDKKNEITHKRLRVLLFTVLYFIVISIVLIAVKDLLVWIESWKLIKWLANKASIPARLTYAVGVFAVIALNFGIGLLFKVLLKFVRIGLKKKQIAEPKGKDGEFTWSQKVERAILKFFHNEKWFFAGKILQFLSITLSAAYALLFLLYQVPVMFGASWIPYAFLERLFDAGYVYPILTLLPLWEAYFFLAGVELIEKECPQLLREDEGLSLRAAKDISKVNEECQKLFKDYFKCQLDPIAQGIDPTGSDYHEVTKLIAQSVETDQRNPQRIKEGYLRCIDAIVRNDIKSTGEDGGKTTTGVLVNGGFFTEFSMYFLRYISVILARGDNVVFVCNDDIQIEEVYSYVNQALSQLYSLYHEDVPAGFDDPVWKICKVSNDHVSRDRTRIDDCSVLITDLKYLCSSDFENKHNSFTHLIDTVVFVDAMASVNTYPRQMALFNTSVKNIRDMNELRAKNSSENLKTNTNINEGFRVRYTSNQIKYVCFDDSRTPGIDRVLKNLLSVDFISADAMKYAPQTIISCYNYDGTPNENGIRLCPQAAKTSEELGVLVNMADFAIAFGADRVSLFADRKVPYADIAESVAANANSGLLVQEKSNLIINDPFYNPDHYQVIVAFDTEDNLPAIVRRYAAMVPEKPTLVMIFSRPYLLRDFYADNINALWKPEQILRIPVEQSGKQNALQRILVRANAGGISEREILDILQDAHLPEYAELLKVGDLNEILRKILLDCGIPQNNALDIFNFFEYDRFRNFDKNGVFVTEDRVRLRKRGMLYDYINGRDLVRLITDGGEMILPISKDRMTQNFIVGQNMLYDGCIYTINSIDTELGKMYIRHATGGRNNVPYQYLQDREYHIDWSDESAQRIYARTHNESKTVDGMTLKEVNITVRRRPMEVITRGYTPVDQRTMAMNGGNSSYVNISGEEQIDLLKQTYRKYGLVKEPVISSDVIMNSKVNMVAAPNGALVMSLRLTGEFGGATDRMATLASAIIGEILRSMFPYVADSIAVCPVVSEKFEEDGSGEVLNKLPKVFCRGYEPNANDFELLIIEDCASDLGVISTLMSSGDDILKVLFAPVFKYLKWYNAAEEKSSYLYYGNESEPACFDFAGLSKLSAIVGDEAFELSFVAMEDIVQFEVCDFCGKRVMKPEDITTLPDGRKVCNVCGANLVSNDKKTLKQHLDRAKVFLESTYGITIDDTEACFDSAMKIVNAIKQNKNVLHKTTEVGAKAYTDDARKVHVEQSIPSTNLAELLVRELTAGWQMKYLPTIAEDMAEGHIALVAVQYLKFLNQNALATLRTNYYESTSNISGEGYRKLVRELLANPKYKNNPFLYLLESSGVETEDKIVTPTIPIVETGDYGKPYTPSAPDRVLDGSVPYFYYSRLTGSQQTMYDLLLAAVLKLQEDVLLSGHTEKDVETVMTSLAFDHPELFWYRTYGVGADRVKLFYGATAEEVAVLQRRIDEVVPQYLEGIDDSMSAYDVAVRLHARVIAAVDYDTLALNKQEQEGGPSIEKIDDLRSITGVFLNGKAVCEGYARAMQYLLQKCGIECAELAGNIRKETGEQGGGHAWNLLKIDGDYYQMDTTWDDGSNTVQTVQKVSTGFDYFCITTQEITRTRALDMCPTDVPNCSATKANFYYHNDLVLDSYDLNKIKQIAQDAAQKKKKAFTFKCKTKAVFDKALEQLCANGQDCYEALKAASKADKQILSNTFSYSYDKNIWTITIVFKTK